MVTWMYGRVKRGKVLVLTYSEGVWGLLAERRTLVLLHHLVSVECRQVPVWVHNGQDVSRVRLEEMRNQKSSDFYYYGM